MRTGGIVKEILAGFNITKSFWIPLELKLNFLCGALSFMFNGKRGPGGNGYSLTGNLNPENLSRFQAIREAPEFCSGLLNGVSFFNITTFFLFHGAFLWIKTSLSIKTGLLIKAGRIL
jgi:hypothetical protein